MSRNTGPTGPEKRKDLAAGAHKTKSREFYDIIRQIGTHFASSRFRVALRTLRHGFALFCYPRNSECGSSDRDLRPVTDVFPLTKTRYPPTGECKNKTDEDAIMRREQMMLRAILSSPKLDKEKMKEYLIRLLYVEMLGHDASFGYIHAVKATMEGNDLSLKRVAYLATTQFLNEDHDLILLIVNAVQRDLCDDNYLVVCAALTTICRLLNADQIPSVLPQVTELLTHQNEHVRKKAVAALHRFHQRAPSSVEHLHGKFRSMLCDKVRIGPFPNPADDCLTIKD